MAILTMKELTAADDVPEFTTESDPLRETRVAIIGHPYVGKSTLLNRLTGRTVPSSRPFPAPRVTRWTNFSNAMETYRFIDTAGIRQKARLT